MVRNKPNIFVMKRNVSLIILLICLILVTNALLRPVSAVADPIIPPTWNAVSDDFESGSLDDWNTSEPDNLHLEAGAGHNGSTGLRVMTNQDKTYITQSRVASAVEGYLSFWLNPSELSLPEEITLHLAQIRGPSHGWPPMIEFCVRKPAGMGHQGLIAWPKADGHFYDRNGQFDLADGWQKITLGYHVNIWVAVWVNDTLVRFYDDDVAHVDSVGDRFYMGKLTENSDNAPSGSFILDDVAFQVPSVDDLWVNANGGSDSNDGSNRNEAFLTIQKAADMAGPGTTVHILPGVYRETVWPALNGTADERVTYLAEDGPGTATIRGSEPASSLTWMQLTADTIGLPPGVDLTKIYSVDLSDWELEGPPRFLVQLDSGGNVTSRLPLAREPDWHVETEWKAHEYWWAADGGSIPAECDPTTDEDRNCDLPQRSMTQLTDRTNDSEPVDIEAGNLTTLGNLTGATLMTMDTRLGNYTFHRTIVAHDVAAGRITVDEICEHDGGTGRPGLGWGSKYYIEGKPRLLDNPGEWWYDTESKFLYLWPPTDSNPASLDIEISKRDNGFRFQNRSYITLDGLTIEFFNQNAVYQVKWSDTEKSYDNTVRNTALRYANKGVSIQGRVSASAPPNNIIDGFTIENSEIAYMDTYGISLGDSWDNNSAADSFTHSGVQNTIIRNNDIHHLGFHSDGNMAFGNSLRYANKLRFENNHVHDIAHFGVLFYKAVVQSPKSYDLAPSEIKLGDILIKDNLFERACQLGVDCGALAFVGVGPDNHVFRNVLVTGNIFRDTYGWAYISEKRGHYAGYGMGGYGLYLWGISGVHAYRNIAYNNVVAGYSFSGEWRDSDIVYYNNIAANSLYGFWISGLDFDTHGHVNTQIMNNIIINNERYGSFIYSADNSFTNMTLDHNLYLNNGWRSSEDGGAWKAGNMVIKTSSPNTQTPYQTLADIQTNTNWEDHGLEGNPAFQNYNINDHEMFDNSWPDFHLTPASDLAIEQGTEELPESLVALLDEFGITDYKQGTAYDIGRYEAGFTLLAEPTTQAIEPGGVAQYTLRIEPNDLAHTISLTATAPSPELSLNLSPSTITASGYATLTITHTHTTSDPLSSVWYTIPVNGLGGGFNQTVTVRLLVGGTNTYLPLVLK